LSRRWRDKLKRRIETKEEASGAPSHARLMRIPFVEHEEQHAVQSYYPLVLVSGSSCAEWNYEKLTYQSVFG
jgi:hypothetical protein